MSPNKYGDRPLPPLPKVGEGVLDDLAELLQLNGVEYFTRYYAVYRGFVEDNADPEKRGRVRVRVPTIGQLAASESWVDPAFDSAGINFGTFMPPELGSVVRVAFEVGDPRKPVIYWGGWHGEGHVPAELAPDSNNIPWRRGFVTRMGHMLVFDDTPGQEAITLQWHKTESGDDSTKDKFPMVASDWAKGKLASIKLTKDGDIQITNQSGSTVQLDAANKKIVIKDENGNVVTLDENGATIDAKKVSIGSGADASAVRGEELVAYLKALTVSTAWGPSGPPIVPPPASILSKVVKVK